MALNLDRKVGPFPVYVWAGMATVAVLAAYMYMRRKGTSPAPDGTVDTNNSGLGVGAIDPTTGLPFSSSGAGSGLTGVPADTGGGAPDLTTEVGHVADLIAALTNAGLLNTGYPDQTGQFDEINTRLTAVRDSITGLQAPLQATADHSVPAGAVAKTIVRPSKSDHNALYVYRQNSNGSLTKLHPAPVGAKADVPKGGTAPKAGTTSGAAHAPASGGSATSGESVKLASGSQSKVGSIVQKKSAEHGNKLSDYRVNSNGSLTWLRVVK